MSNLRAIATVSVINDFNSNPLLHKHSRITSFLNTLRDHPLLEEYVTKDLLGKERQYDWTLLESLIVCEEVLYDGYAFERYPLTITSGELTALKAAGLKEARASKAVYKRTHDAVQSFQTWLEKKGLRTCAKGVPYYEDIDFCESNDAFWEHEAKHHHDGLSHAGLGHYSFADSSQSFERALFYLEFAREMGCPLLPRPSKYRSALEVFARSYEQTIHASLSKSIQARGPKIDVPGVDVKLPPLALSIILRSIRERRHILDVVSEVRASANARSYRALLSELTEEVLKPNPNSDKLTTVQKDIEFIVTKWKEEGRPDEGLKYRTRSIRIQVLPSIAGLVAYISTNDPKVGATTASASNVAAQAIFGNSITVKDPILWGAEKYLTFVSGWYF